MEIVLVQSVFCSMPVVLVMLCALRCVVLSSQANLGLFKTLQGWTFFFVFFFGGFGQICWFVLHQCSEHPDHRIEQSVLRKRTDACLHITLCVCV